MILSRIRNGFLNPNLLSTSGHGAVAGNMGLPMDVASFTSIYEFQVIFRIEWDYRLPKVADGLNWLQTLCDLPLLLQTEEKVYSF